MFNSIIVEIKRIFPEYRFLLYAYVDIILIVGADITPNQCRECSSSLLRELLKHFEPMAGFDGNEVNHSQVTSTRPASDR